MPNIISELVNLAIFLPAYYLASVSLHYFTRTEWREQTQGKFLRFAVTEASQKNVDMATTHSYQLFSTLGAMRYEAADAFNPILWDYPYIVSQLQDIELRGLEKLRSTGIFGVVIGLIVGALAPFYLGVTGRWQIGLMVLGSAIFCVIGLSSLLSHKIGSIGFGFAVLAFAFLNQYILVEFGLVLESQFFIIKILILLCLCFALRIFVFVSSDSSTSLQEITSEGANKTKSRMFDWFLKIAGAALTVIEFINLITGMWKK